MDSANAATFGQGDAALATAMNAGNPDAPVLTDQVSFIVRHDVKPGRHEQYEEWLKKTIAEASKFHGHMGAQVVRPTADGSIYEIAVRFATRSDAEAWIHSEKRKQLVAELSPHIQSPETLNIKSGIDYWFTSVTEGHKPPRRWKQWMTSVSVIWPLTIIVPWVLGPVFRAVPFLEHWGVRQLVVAMAVVAMVVYVVMPPYTRAIAKWLSR
ncbi:MAG: antibiotic biosynthesis monooxygenase [Planctomycetes bacterium]|nr:antibiotic biosynthesis monooxygenase [Planctomycetota bacterium]